MHMVEVVDVNMMVVVRLIKVVDFVRLVEVVDVSMMVVVRAIKAVDTVITVERSLDSCK